MSLIWYNQASLYIASDPVFFFFVANKAYIERLSFYPKKVLSRKTTISFNPNDQLVYMFT